MPSMIATGGAAPAIERVHPVVERGPILAGSALISRPWTIGAPQ